MDIVEELRTKPTGDPHIHARVHRAADEIDALRAQVAALTEQRDNIMDNDLKAQALVEQEQEIERLIATLGKAREALEKIGDMANGWGSPQFVTLEALAAIDRVLNQQEISRQATGACSIPAGKRPPSAPPPFAQG